MDTGELFAYSWHVDDDEKMYTIIRIYGLNNKNETVCLVVKNFTPYVYLQLPDDIEWNEYKVKGLTDRINTIMEMPEGDFRPLKMQLMMKKRLYYAEMVNNERKLFPYLCLTFQHSEHIEKFSRKFRYPMYISGMGKVEFKVHEHNAGPILQLTSLRKLPTAGWIKFTGRRIKPDEQHSSCPHEYVVKWKDLEPKVSDAVVRPYLMSFDIEVYSHRPSVMPDPGEDKDEIFQISCIFSRQGNKDYEKYLLTLGEPDEKGCGENVKIRKFDLEYQLLDGFANIIQEKQPNIIMGYNIFGFDLPHMIARAEFIGSPEFRKQGFNRFGNSKERVIEWSSAAYKNQSFRFLDAEGRLLFDLLPQAKRLLKLSSYSLKAVSSHVLKNATKDPLDAKGIFKCYEIGIGQSKQRVIPTEKSRRALALVGKYCIQDSILVTQLFETMTTWIALCEMSKVTGVPIFSLCTQGQQLKAFSQVYRKCTHENIVVEKEGYKTKENDHYVGATVFPPTPGIYEKVVSFDFTSLYPTTIIAYNICWSTLVEDEKVPDDLCHVMEWDDHIGCIHDPKEIRKAELTKQLKVKEDELKEIRRQRVLKTNKNRQEEFRSMIEDFVQSIKPLRQERSQLMKSKGKHIICAHRKYRWIKTPKGVLPEILSNLLDTRSLTKKEMKKVKSTLATLSEESPQHQELSTYYDVLDQRQLEMKISANSGYGCMGVRRGYLPFMPGAMCTTYMGRQAIEKAAKSIQRDYKGKLIYGDSVSSDTPILVRNSKGNVVVRQIDSIGTEWSQYDEFKPFDTNRKEKEQSCTEFEVWTHKGWSKIKRVIRHKTAKKMFRVATRNGIVDVTEDHSLLTDKERKIKPEQLRTNTRLLQSLPDLSNLILDGMGEKVALQQRYLSLKTQGYNPIIRYKNDTIFDSGTYSNKVVSITELPPVTYDKYVYDLETEQGVFQAGIGELIVKNTDSNYVSFPHLESVADCWDYSVKVAENVTKLYPRPMSLAFEEKIYMKFLIITKKKYLCLACERDGKVGDKILNKGVILTRRDNCPFIRKVYSEVVMMIFHRVDRNKIIEYILDEINKLCSHSYSVDQFVVTKSVGDIGDLIPRPGKDKNDKDCFKVGDYKVTLLPEDPKKRERKFELKECDNERDYYLRCMPPQVQLAEKIRQRGQLLPAGTRLEYVITDQEGHTANQSKKIESYEYFIKHSQSLQLDYFYYLKQLVTPLDQILDIIFTNQNEKGFVMKQYKYRLKVRKTVLDSIKTLCKPKLKFVN